MFKTNLFATILAGITMSGFAHAESFLDYNKTLKDLQMELKPYNDLIIGHTFYDIESVYSGNRRFTNNQRNMVISTYDHGLKLFLYDFQSIMKSRQVMLKKGKKQDGKLYHLHKSSNDNCLYFVDQKVEYILVKKIKYVTTKVGRHGAITARQIQRACGA